MRITAFLIFYLLTIATCTITSRMEPQKKPFNGLEFFYPLKEMPFALTTVGAFLFALGFFIPLNFVVLEATHYGMSGSLSQYLVSILNAVSLLGRIISGYLADHLGNLNIMLSTCLATGTIPYT